MSAPTHTPIRPAPPLGAQTRLPWWALALPVLAFTVLLALIVSPVDAHAAVAPGAGVTQVLEFVRDVLLRMGL